MNLTKKLLVEMIQEEIKNNNNLDEQYDLVIEKLQFLFKERLDEAERVSRGAFVTQPKVNYKPSPNVAKFMSASENEAMRALEGVIYRFVNKAREQKIPNPENFVFLLVDNIINKLDKNTANILKHFQQATKVVKTADEFEKNVKDDEQPSKFKQFVNKAKEKIGLEEQ